MNSNKKILVAEDDPLNMKLFKDLLEVKLFNVICVDNGEYIVKQMLQHKPNLVLMDIRLHNLSGLDIIKEIKDIDEIKQIPIIALTAFAMKNDKERILRSGFEHYMSKPISIDSFFKTIDEFLSVS